MTRGTTPPVVAGYVVGQLLGSGGLGTVWEARRADGTAVALKVVEPRRPLEATVVDRLFRREALAALHLDHPGLVRALDAGRSNDGRPFIAFELLTGRTLAAEFRERGALPATEVVEIGRALAAALDHAHRLGVVHGDVSPANVLLAPRGPVLLDLGLVRELASAEDAEIFASPGFTDPAVVGGAPRTASSDLYALGMTLAAARLGRPLLTTAGLKAYVTAARNGDPAMPAAPGENAVEGSLRIVIQRLIRGDPTARYPSAAALRLDLDAVRAGESPLGAVLAAASDSGGASSPARAARRVRITAFLVTTVVAGAVLYAMWPSGPTAPELETSGNSDPRSKGYTASTVSEIAPVKPDSAEQDVVHERATPSPPEPPPDAAPEIAPPALPAIPATLVDSVRVLTSKTADAEVDAVATTLDGFDASTLGESDLRLLEDLRATVAGVRRQRAAASREEKRSTLVASAFEEMPKGLTGHRFLVALEEILARIPVEGREKEEPVGFALREFVLRARRAESRLRGALAPMVERSWAWVQDARVVVALVEEPPDPWTCLGETQVFIFKPERFVPTTEDVVRLVGDEVDAFCWLLAARSHLPGPRGERSTLWREEPLSTLKGFFIWGSKELRDFRDRSILTLRQNGTRFRFRDRDPVVQAWATFLAAPRAAEPPPDSPDRDLGLRAYLADDLPVAWEHLERAATLHPLDAETAVLRARILRDAAAPLPTTAVLVYALSEARRAMDLDPTLPAAPLLVAEIAMELETTRPATFERHLRPLIMLAGDACLRLGRETAPLLLYLGRARSEDGDRVAAHIALRRARDLMGDELPSWAADLLDAPR